VVPASGEVPDAFDRSVIAAESPGGILGNWRTGQVIRNARGVSRQQLYFYRVMGLIEPAGRTGNGRWLYDGRVFARLAEIAELRRRGKTLRQIREELSAGGSPLAQSSG